MSTVNLMADEITGPLEVIERDIGGLEYFIVPAGGMISADLASGLIDRDDRTPEQMRAWARLFASSPELLFALKALVAWQAEIKHAVPLSYLEGAKRAIAKAEGRS